MVMFKQTQYFRLRLVKECGLLFLHSCQYVQYGIHHKWLMNTNNFFSKLQVFKKDIHTYTVMFGKQSSLHSSLLIQRGQVSTQKGHWAAGQGKAKGGSENCVTENSFSDCLVYLLCELMNVCVTEAMHQGNVCSVPYIDVYSRKNT